MGRKLATRLKITESIKDVLNYIDELESTIDRKDKQIETLIKEVSLLEVKLNEK